MENLFYTNKAYLISNKLFSQCSTTRINNYKTYSISIFLFSNALLKFFFNLFFCAKNVMPSFRICLHIIAYGDESDLSRECRQHNYRVGWKSACVPLYIYICNIVANITPTQLDCPAGGTQREMGVRSILSYIYISICLHHAFQQ